MKIKKICFLSGTRADFGKIKSLLNIIEASSNFEAYIFVTGMHMLKKYGLTKIEIEKCNYQNIYTFSNHTDEKTMDLTLAKTITGFSKYVKDIKPDLIVVHGDRVEALAGAIVGSLNNIKVAHIEGGEISGTIDELIRHSVSKMSHIHLVSNEEAKKRLLQMGELDKSIKIIGSPDIDIMFSEKLPSLNKVKAYYEINFKNFAIVMFHPVTTEFKHMAKQTKQFVDALLEDNTNYVVIYPNNDLGSNLILEEYKRLENNKRFRIFPSLRFEFFLVMLKNCQFIIGNSSAGIREAPYYNLPSINIGSRQNNRAFYKSIANVACKKNAILQSINALESIKTIDNYKDFGTGKSDELFLEFLNKDFIWNTDNQKQFVDI